MSRIVRSPEPSQPVLPLGHGPIQWRTLPEAVRERVLPLWIQLLSEHLTHAGAEGPSAGPATGRGAAPPPEKRA